MPTSCVVEYSGCKFSICNPVIIMFLYFEISMKGIASYNVKEYSMNCFCVKIKSLQLVTFSNTLASIFCGNKLLSSFSESSSSFSCGATGWASYGTAQCEPPVKTLGLWVSFNTGVVELNLAWLAALVLVAIPVMTLVALDESEGRVVLFAPYLAENVFEGLIVAPHARCMMASASASRQDLLWLRL